MKSIAFEFEQMPHAGTLAERVIALASMLVSLLESAYSMTVRSKNYFRS
jgi:hypothetical protein